MMEKETLIRKIIVKREQKIRLARANFWFFCRLLEPDFYTESKPHLKILCDTLQALYECRIIRKNLDERWTIIEHKPQTEDFEVCRNIIIQIPPRHGKSRTAKNFYAWVLGKNPKEKILNFSYDNRLAMSASKNCRALIKGKAKNEASFCYSAIFPSSFIKRGSDNMDEWSLEGTNFSFGSASPNSGVTGRGGTILAFDDPHKDLAEANNPTELLKKLEWKVGTANSRMEGDGFEIIIMTPWCKGDVSYDAINGSDGHLYYVVDMPIATELVFSSGSNKKASDLVSATMLCPEIYSFKKYKRHRKKSALTPATWAVFLANYHNQRIDVQGLLYGDFKTYNQLPSQIERLFCYTDTADTGDNYLCSIIAVQSHNMLYIKDIYYTQANMEQTEQEHAHWLVKNEAIEVMIESNNGGRGYMRNVKRIVEDELGYYGAVFIALNQRANKQARIFTQSANVMNKIVLPQDWKIRWPLFFEHISVYKAQGKNRFDDAPDTLTGLLEHTILGYTNNGSEKNNIVTATTRKVRMF